MLIPGLCAKKFWFLRFETSAWVILTQMVGGPAFEKYCSILSFDCTQVCKCMGWSRASFFLTPKLLLLRPWSICCCLFCGVALTFLNTGLNPLNFAPCRPLVCPRALSLPYFEYHWDMFTISKLPVIDLLKSQTCLSWVSKVCFIRTIN